MPWIKQESGTVQRLRSVFGLSRSSVYACGDNGTVLHFNGVAWAPEALPVGVAAENFRAITAITTDGGEVVFAFSATGRLVRKQLGNWTDVGFVMANGNAVNGAWGWSQAHLWATQAVGKYEQSGDDGDTWPVAFTDGGGVSGPIRGFDPTHVYSVGGTDQIVYWDGAVAHDYVPGAVMRDVWPDAALTGYAVADAAIFRFTVGGSVVAPNTIPDADVLLRSVHGASPTQAFAVGKYVASGLFRALRLASPGVWVDDVVIGATASDPAQLWIAPGGIDGWAVCADGAIFALVPLAVDGAVAVAVNTVRVTLNGPPLASSPVGDGDAFNPASWQITRVDTGDPFTIMAIVSRGAAVFDVVLYDLMPSVQIDLRVDASLLRDSNGLPIGPGFLADFLGVLSDAEATQGARAASRQIVVTDIANPPLPAGLMSVGGVRVVSAAGDYAAESGAALVKKLILRRLVTKPGEFYHLPDYGVGLGVKEPIPAKDLRALKKTIETQLAQEPEIASVTVGVELLAANNVVVISISADLVNSSDPVQVKVAKTPTGVSVLET